jgi:hypothetical protein
MCYYDLIITISPLSQQQSHSKHAYRLTIKLTKKPYLVNPPYVSTHIFTLLFKLN